MMGKIENDIKEFYPDVEVKPDKDNVKDEEEKDSEDEIIDSDNNKEETAEEEFKRRLINSTTEPEPDDDNDIGVKLALDKSGKPITKKEIVRRLLLWCFFGFLLGVVVTMAVMMNYVQDATILYNSCMENFNNLSNSVPEIYRIING